MSSIFGFVSRCRICQYNIQRGRKSHTKWHFIYFYDLYKTTHQTKLSFKKHFCFHPSQQPHIPIFLFFFKNVLLLNVLTSNVLQVFLSRGWTVTLVGERIRRRGIDLGSSFILIFFGFGPIHLHLLKFFSFSVPPPLVSRGWKISV